MREVPEGRDDSEVGEGDPVDPPLPPPFELDGRDILARACMAALREGQKDPANFDFSTAVFEALANVTNHPIGPFEPSEWLCINLGDYRVGRAYPYKGEHRIVAVTPDEGLLADIDEEIINEG